MGKTNDADVAAILARAVARVRMLRRPNEPVEANDESKSRSDASSDQTEHCDRDGKEANR